MARNRPKSGKKRPGKNARDSRRAGGGSGGSPSGSAGGSSSESGRDSRKHSRGSSRSHASASSDHQSPQSSGRREHGRGRAASKERQAKRTSPSRPGNVLRGTVQKNPRGFAFLIPEKKGIPDAFVPAEDALSLLAGDIVEFTVRQNRGRSRAEILKVVERKKKKAIGEVVTQNEDRFVRTFSNDYFWIPNTERVEDGDWVVGDIVHYPNRQSPGTIRVTENFGNKLSPKQDLQFAIAEFGLQDEFTAESLGYALKKRLDARREIDATVGRKAGPGERRDLTAMDFVTIDGPDAKDYDDAVFVESPKGGETMFILYVAIADVAFFVTPGSPLDKDAQLRATSVYFPGFCLPMLPESLSNDMCSLRPREKKLSLVAEIHFDRDTEITKTDFYEGVIETKARLTYEEANLVAEGKESPYVAILKPMRNLFKKMWVKRQQRGSLDFTLKENKVQVDAEGTPIKISHAESFETNRWIEEFMVAANRVVAKELREAGQGALYRVHEPPDPKALDELNGLFKAMGFNYRMKDITSMDFHNLLKNLEGHPKAGPLNYLILRHQKQAHYFPEPLGHFGLALEDYAHFTSPIRRYPDLVVHRSMKRLIKKRKGSDTEGAEEDYYALGQMCSQRERVATDAERWVVARKQAWFFEKRVGEIVRGVITGMSARGLFMELDGSGAEGMLEYDRFPDAVEFDEQKYRLYMKNRKSLSLGDSFDVLIAKIRWEDNRILLDVAEKF